MIQDIAPHCYHNEFQDRKAQPEDLALVFRDRETLIREGEEISFFTLGELAEKKEGILEKAVYLFSIDDRCYYLVPEEAADPGGRRRKVGEAFLFPNSPPDVFGFCGGYGASALRLVSSSEILWRLRQPYDP